MKNKQNHFVADFPQVFKKVNHIEYARYMQEQSINDGHWKVNKLFKLVFDKLFDTFNTKYDQILFVSKLHEL